MTAQAFIVVVHYGKPELTTRAASSACHQTVPTSVVVMDNGPEGASAPDVLDANVVRGHGNLLWTPAINFAVGALRGAEPVTLWMNNDIVLSHEAVERMVRVLARQGAGLVGPVGSRIGGKAGVPNPVDAHLAGAGGELMSAQVSGRAPFVVPFVSGCCCAARSDVFDRLGGLDESMPLGADDHDISLRAKRAGWRLYCAADAWVDHVGHASGGAEKVWSEHGRRSWDAFNVKWVGDMTPEEAEEHWGGTSR